MGFEFRHNFCVIDFLAPIWAYFLIVDDEKGVGDIDARACDRGRGANALAEAAEFIEVGLVPCALELGMAEELEILRSLDSVRGPGQAWTSGQGTLKGSGNRQLRM